jgi:hypothetical protein
MSAGQGFIHDERGSRSSARLLLYIVTAQIIHLIEAAVFFAAKVPAEAWVILTAMFMALAGWAAGPRIAQVISPIGTKALESLADVIRARRDPKDGVEPAP